MRFLIDAQLPPGLVDLFESAGLEAVHVLHRGLLEANDRSIWTAAMEGNFVIVTKDEDFAVMRRVRESGPSVIWIRIGNTSKKALIDRLSPRLQEIFDALSDGETLIEIR